MFDFIFNNNRKKSEAEALKRYFHIMADSKAFENETYIYRIQELDILPAKAQICFKVFRQKHQTNV